METEVRGAGPHDVTEIAALVASYAKLGELLPRTRGEIASSLDDWVVAVRDDAVQACGSLVHYTSTLTEVRSLAVADGAKRNGLGMAIGRALIDEARGRGIATLFALTRATGFFQKLGFELSPAARFPEKVWRDCRMCPIQDRCDEVAVVMYLNGA
ncbi:MAG: N-acetyltransferase [Anaerolineae bacterium]|nr:MAG: N-acetyltransferase [Anaerolineae bacterium]